MTAPATYTPFPARILALLHEVADRNSIETHGPFEDGNVEPMQDDADAALLWISAALQAAVITEHVYVGMCPDEVTGHAARDPACSACSAINAVVLAVQPISPTDAQSPYDQTALELCATCGWKTLIPGDCCLNCARLAAMKGMK